jgi:hypothetical protein
MDVVFLVLETEPEIVLPSEIWVKINMSVSSYFLMEYALRLSAYGAFGETLREFISSSVGG